MKIRKIRSLSGELKIPGDKSISHRAIMFGSISKGTTSITNFLAGADCLSTISCFRKMGVFIEHTTSGILVHGHGLHGLYNPYDVLDAGNSGTTTRLLAGILAGQSFESQLTGDASLCQRPMNRIITPLKQMGADIQCQNDNGCAPLYINGRPLKGIHYDSPVASAQVKSCILLAGLYADSPTSVTEPALSRNHTELMLNYFGADITCKGTTSIIQPGPVLKAREIRIPGDISSAAYFIAAGLLAPNSEILLRNVGINPTRDGILKVCQAMGGDIRLENIRPQGGELTADILVRSSSLHGTEISGDIIPTLIDELPVIAVLAAFAQGTTTIRDAAELKVKESDRISVMCENLSKMGVEVTAAHDGMVIHGGRPLHGAVIDTYQDHRIAMSFAVAGAFADGETELLNSDCVTISYPDFYQDLYHLCKE